MDKSALLSAIARDELSLDWFKLPLIAATSLVAIGLVIEYWPEFEKFDLRQYNPDLIKALVGGIIVTLAIAVEVLLTFFAQRAETTLRTDNESYIGLLKKEASEADEHAHLLEKETQQLRAANLALEAEIAPRNVSDDDIKRLIDVLKPFSGDNISVKSYLGDSEGRRLLTILTTVFSRAGLKAPPGYIYFDESSKMAVLERMELKAPRSGKT